MNKNFTEQQNRIRTALFELLFTTGKGLVNVEFCFNDPDQREKRTTSAKRGGRYGQDSVILTLVEPTNIQELNEWAEAIIEAEQLACELEREKLHEISTPNFFKSITSEYHYKQQRGL